MTIDFDPSPRKELAAVCGLFCPSCSVYIASHEDPARLEYIASMRGISAEEARCEGCRSSRRFPFCKTCKMYACAEEKGLDFCGECADFPCADVREFQSILPHRLELFASQERIRSAGFETWYSEMLTLYACPKCGTLNSAYDARCRKCGAEPASAYNEKHKEDIAARLVQSKRTTVGDKTK